MITVLVQFQMPEGVALADAAAIFRSTAPRYLGMEGLVRKYYVFDPLTRRAGGCYLMPDRAAAERVFDASWKKVVAERYGAEPGIIYFDTPVIVDNLTREILVDGVAAPGEASVQGSEGHLGYRLVGNGPEPVIMLHDWTSTSESYAGIVPLLDTASYTWCFPDLRGYGRSWGLSGAYTSIEAAGDIFRLAGKLGWVKFHLAGHSMSGQIVQRAAMMHPERLASLTCITPVPASGVPIDPESRAMFRSAAEDEGNWKTISRMLTGARLPESWYALKHASFAANVQAEAFLGFLGMWTGENFASGMPVINLPVQVILGGHDMEVFHEGPMREAFVKPFPRAHFEVLTDAGHYPMAETPVRFVRLVEDFLARHPAGA